MSKQTNTPRVGQPIGTVKEQGGSMVALCNLWLQQTLKFLGRNPVTTPVFVPPTGSPFNYTNDDDFDVDVIINSGTVTSVSFSRDGLSYYTVAQNTNTTVRLNPGDSLRVAYTLAPSLILIPR